MLKKTQRTHAADVTEIRARGKSHRGDYVTVRAMKAEGASKAGVVVSKKVARSAVERNTLKRKVRAALAPLLREHPTGLHVLVYPTAAARAQSVATLQKDIETALAV